MRFLLGSNMNIVVLQGYKNLVGGIFPRGGRLSKACADDTILVK